MNIPGFVAESSLNPTMGIYRGRVQCDRPGRDAVSMQLDDPKFPKNKALRLNNWDRLFESSGPLEQTCDTGGADCAKRCTNILNEAYATCHDISDATARLTCYDDALKRGVECQKNCSTSFPPSPACPPIGL
jgi:hypothetical protein